MNTFNSGMFLEELINSTNKFYEENDLALVNKVSIPIKIKAITDIDVLGTISSPSTVDYIGLYQGQFIAFEAKQTTKDKFYISTIKNHQLSFLNKVDKLGGIAFIIFHFSKFEKYYRVDIKDLQEIKSINIEWLEENGKEISISFPLILNYLFI